MAAREKPGIAATLAQSENSLLVRVGVHQNGLVI
jgi:hypothetical protein